MKNTFCILLTIPFLFSACESTQENVDSSSTSVAVEFNPIVLKARETSLYADQVDWNEINRRFVELTTENSGDVKEALQYLINSLGDEHGTIRSATDYSIIVSYSGERREKDNRDPEFLNNVINDVSAQFSFKLLENKIGYLKVVGIGPGDVKSQADSIRKGLVDLKSRGVDKWILDLRFNGGGNMEPMIAGLAPLVGNGLVGGAMNSRKEMTREYLIEDGQFFNTGRLVCKMDNVPGIEPNEKVVVLLGRYTASSGELVAVVFKGRANTKFIGEESAGYTTGNGFDPVNEELVLVISQDLFMDRNKIRYDQRIGVDEEIEFEHNVELENDLQVGRAKAWLNR